MVVVRLCGGLGNQMFQYAFARSLSVSGIDVVLDWHGYSRKSRHNGFELDQVFSIPLSERMLFSNASLLLGARCWWERKVNRIRESFDLSYDPGFCEIQSGYLDGYWQSERYFRPAVPLIQSDFSFKPLSGAENLALSKIMDNTSCVSVHLRRGDYQSHPELGGVCTHDYYRGALAYVLRKDPSCTPVIFSDDIPYCKTLFKGQNVVYTGWNKGNKSWMDMALMSKCRHHIIANSSFSWWGAWLGQREDTITIAPKYWFQPGAKTCNRDIYPDGWIRL